MEKLAKLSSKEESGEQSLSGLFRITMDVTLTDQQVDVLKASLKALGDIEDMTIERHASESPFNIGDTVELTSEFTCDKSIYQDSHGNLVISDKPVTGSVEKIGEFRVSLPAGTTAEVNRKSINGSVEVLFTGESIYLDDISRIAYLGIMELPVSLLAK
jgi:hypothetical protein